MQQGEGSDLEDGDMEDEDGAGGALWGKKRRMYYGEDEEGATDEDEVRGCRCVGDCTAIARVLHIHTCMCICTCT